jgi:hypothetical protein
MFALIHISTWNFGWQILALALPPLIFAMQYRGLRRSKALIAAGLLLIANAIYGTIRDFNLRQAIHSIGVAQGYTDPPVPWVYVSAADFRMGLLRDGIGLGVSAMVTGIAWVGYRRWKPSGMTEHLRQGPTQS